MSSFSCGDSSRTGSFDQTTIAIENLGGGVIICLTRLFNLWQFKQAGNSRPEHGMLGYSSHLSNTSTSSKHTSHWGRQGKELMECSCKCNHWDRGQSESEKRIIASTHRCHDPGLTGSDPNPLLGDSQVTWLWLIQNIDSGLQNPRHFQNFPLFCPCLYKQLLLVPSR